MANGSVNFVFGSPYSLVPIAMIIIGFYLRSKLGGKYKAGSQQYTDAKGQIRARHKIQFQR
jgi:hypothetical protein